MPCTWSYRLLHRISPWLTQHLCQPKTMLHENYLTLTRFAKRPSELGGTSGTLVFYRKPPPAMHAKNSYVFTFYMMDYLGSRRPSGVKIYQIFAEGHPSYRDCVKFFPRLILPFVLPLLRGKNVTFDSLKISQFMRSTSMMEAAKDFTILPFK